MGCPSVCGVELEGNSNFCKWYLDVNRDGQDHWRTQRYARSSNLDQKLRERRLQKIAPIGQALRQIVVLARYNRQETAMKLSSLTCMCCLLFVGWLPGAAGEKKT